MADEHGNFASLGREDAGMTVIFLRLGCEVLPESYRHVHAAGLFQVADPNGVIIQLVEWVAATEGEWSQPAA